ncbi:MAG: glycosyltransferase family 39 protein [Christensenella sp.]|nr:glycosyltransferase family 39 protein [Christensenella sp.]
MNKTRIGKHSVWDVLRREHILLVILVFLFYYAWSVTVPPNVAPDEGMRYQIPNFIMHNGYLPNGADPAIRDATWGISYGFAPYLAQMISAGFMKITSLFTQNGLALLHAARLVSVLCATATVWVAIKISGHLFSGVSRALFVVLIAVLPQFLYLSSYINNDIFAIFSTSVILYAWVTGLKQKWPTKSCVLLGIGMGLCAMSYYNAYGWLLASVILFFVSSLAFDKQSIKKRDYRVKIYMVAGLFLAIAAWWFIRSYVIYDGDIFGMNITEHYKELYAATDFKPSHYQTVQEQGLSLYSMLIPMGWIKLTYCSAIGCFGSMDLWLPIWIYILYSAIFLLALIGCVMRFSAFLKEKRGKEHSRKWLMGICLLLTIVIPIALSVYYSYTSDFQPQGRYILSMLLSFMLFVTIGIRAFLDRFFKKKTANCIIIVLCVGLAVVAVYCLMGVLMPHYA